MKNLKSYDQFNIRGDLVFTVDSPVKCERNLKSFVKATKGRIKIDGTVYKVLRVDMFMPATPLREKERICVMVR